MGIKCCGHVPRVGILEEAQLVRQEMQTGLRRFKYEIRGWRIRTRPKSLCVDESQQYGTREQLRRMVRPSVRHNIFLQRLWAARAFRRPVRERDWKVQKTIFRGSADYGCSPRESAQKFYSRRRFSTRAFYGRKKLKCYPSGKAIAWSQSWTRRAQRKNSDGNRSTLCANILSRSKKRRHEETCSHFFTHVSPLRWRGGARYKRNHRPHARERIRIRHAHFAIR